MADIFNKPVNTVMNFSSAARGAFLLNAIDMGIYSSFEEAAGSTAFEETIQPKEQNHEVYLRYFKIFERLSVKLHDEFEEIASLQQGLE
jgi:gluconokinase